MKELSVDDRKKMLLEIMDIVHVFCEDNNIRYYLHAGTLLGAVRHNGYIPWDDDFDICMPRPDYEKFLSVFTAEKLYLNTYKTEKNNVRPYAKICSKNTLCTNLIGYKLSYSLGIDVFPIDGFPEDEKLCEKFFRKQDFLFHYFFVVATMCESKNPQKNVFRAIVLKILGCSFFKIFNSSYYSRRIDNRAIKNDFNVSSYAGCSVGIYRRKIEKTLKSSFTTGISHSFEDRVYMIPADYDNILKSLYGENYMIPPSEKDRESTHCEKYYLI